jgi:hypothetical protein
MISDQSSCTARKVRKYPDIGPATQRPKNACISRYRLGISQPVQCPITACKFRYPRIARLPNCPISACKSRYFPFPHQQFQQVRKTGICKNWRVIAKYYGGERLRITRHSPPLPNREAWGSGTASPDPIRGQGVLLSIWSPHPTTCRSQDHRHQLREADHHPDDPSHGARSQHRPAPHHDEPHLPETPITTNQQGPD